MERIILKLRKEAIILFFFYIISAIIIILVVLTIFTTIQIHIENIRFSTDKIQGKHLNKKYKIIIKLYLFQKINYLKLDITRRDIKKRVVQINVDKFKEKIIKDENNFDIILCGFHKPVWADKLSDYTNIFYNSYSKLIYEPTKEQIAKNTRAYINLIKSKPIDIVSHINYHLRVNIKEVAKAASDYGVALEVSTRHSDCTKDDYEALFASKAMLTLNSDAHKVEDIGKIDKALKVIDEYNVDPKRIINSEYCEFKFKSRTK